MATFAYWREGKVGAVTVENRTAVPQKIKGRITMWPQNLIPEDKQERIEGGDLTRHLYICVHSDILHDNQKVETTWVSDWWMEKQNVVYMYDGILFSPKKERDAGTCFNTGEPWWFVN